MAQERGSREVDSSGSWRRKGFLDTPLGGLFLKEGEWLVFSAPSWYDNLNLCCLLGGPAAALLGYFLEGLPLIGDPLPRLILGIGVGTAGLWGWMSSERFTCDIAAGTYTRIEGQGLGRRILKGNLAELDAMVLLAEEYPFSAGLHRTVVYRLVVHWKGRRHPLLVVERESMHVPVGTAIQSGAGPMLARGSQYARALGIRFFDNSYYHSPGPLPLV